LPDSPIRHPNRTAAEPMIAHQIAH
jgi:hypothetical protein